MYKHSAARVQLLLISRHKKGRRAIPEHFYVFVICDIISLGWHAQRRVYSSGYTIFIAVSDVSDRVSWKNKLVCHKLSGKGNKWEGWNGLELLRNASFCNKVYFFTNRRQRFIEEGAKIYVSDTVIFVKTSTEERLVIFKRKRPKFNADMAIFATKYSFIQILQFKNDVAWCVSNL